MKNIFIEGIQGAGKSSLLQELSRMNPDYHICREGDYSPVELAWCSWLTEQEYISVLEKYSDIKDDISKNTVKEGNYYVVSYTKIITDIGGFHKYMEEFEIYNGRKSFEELERIVCERYDNFTGENYLFECAFLQNIVEALILFHMLSDDEIVEFYKRLYDKVNKDKFLLLYLQSEDIKGNIDIIRSERSDAQGNQLWYQLMFEYFINSPYGKKNGCRNYEDLIEHFMHRQALELRIIDEVVGENAVVLTSKKWDKEMLNL